MPLESLNHYLIYAEDLEATKNFYVDVLGLRVGERPPFPFPGYWLYSGDTACVHVAHAKADAAQKSYLGDKQGAATAGTGAIDHVAFVATGLRKTLGQLAAHGVATRRRTVPEDGSHQVFIEDPNGITIELNFRAGELERIEGD